jgi:hypothetical protein
MNTNLEDYKLLSKIFSGNNLIIIFQNKMDIHDRRVLELNDVAGFLDQSEDAELGFLSIVESGGSYPFDLAYRLNRPEVKDFPEALLFVNNTQGRFRFRACAKRILLREWAENDVWLK